MVTSWDFDNPFHILRSLKFSLNLSKMKKKIAISDYKTKHPFWYTLAAVARTYGRHMLRSLC